MISEYSAALPNRAQPASHAQKQLETFGSAFWAMRTRCFERSRSRLLLVRDRHFRDAADRGRDDFVESSFGDRLVKQQELFLVWRLKDRCPPFEVSPCDRRGAPFARRIASLSSLD